MSTAPRLTRHHERGAESARGLLFTVLGECVLPRGGQAWTSAFIEVLGRLGVEEKATRQALMRTASDGWLATERVGRRTRWTLTAAARRLLEDGTRRIYGFDAAGTDWDGRWLLLLARAPETDRPARHLLRTRLTWAGFGSPSPGVWVSTHSDRADEAWEILRAAGLADDGQLFEAMHHGGALPTLVDQAWDLSALDDSYRRFVAEFDRDGDHDDLARLIELVHAWRRFPWTDPGLPAELLPAGWTGARATRLFTDRHAALADSAHRDWQALNASDAA